MNGGSLMGKSAPPDPDLPLIICFDKSGCQGKQVQTHKHHNSTMDHRNLAPDLLRRLRTGLPVPALDALEACERLARERGLPLYLVGGAVRDLLLEREGYDLDLAVAGEVVDLAH